MDFPTGTVTFLFTDIEGSTRLWEQYPNVMGSALARHDRLVRDAIVRHRGYVFKTVGDAFCAAFHTAPDALAAAFAAQCALLAESWEADLALRVRMALHTGETVERDNDYFGPPVNRVARLLAIGHGGQILLTQTTEHMAHGHLPEGVSLKAMGSHRLKDLQAPEHVFQLLHPSLLASFPPLNSLDNLPTNLPRQLTTFVGREQEIVEVKRKLADVPLLTLTGSGGCGKTRLALQVAADLLDAYPEGVFLVELAALSEGRLVPQEIASALGLREQLSRTLTETLADHLTDRTLLLLLDNCEHLVEACAQVSADLLATCPHLKILATSREALHVPGEQIWRVPPLQPPDLTHLPSDEKDLVSALMEYDACRLFVERAQSHRPEFALTQQNASALAQICHRLDGIPLALELAAAQVRVMPVEQIAKRLNDRLQLLRSGSRMTPSRQQTLDALIDWSYDLLSGEERVLLGRLSVFAGGWTLDAAEQVCAGEGVLDLLTSLVDKSLVNFEPEENGDGRYRMLEMVRQYGLKRLEESEDAEALRARHCNWFVSLAEEAHPQLSGSETARWLKRLEREQENFRAALSWCQATDGATGIRLVALLGSFWRIRGFLSEARERHREALAHPEAQSLSMYRVDVLNGAGIVAWRQGEYTEARRFGEEQLDIAQQIQYPQGVSNALSLLANIAWYQGDHARAETLYEQFLAEERKQGDPKGIAIALNNLGLVAVAKRDFARARACYEESLELRRQAGNRLGTAIALLNLGELAIEEGKVDEGRELIEQSLVIDREMGDRLGIAYALHALGRIALTRGQRDEARAFLLESLALRREIGEKWGIAILLPEFARLKTLEGQPKAGASLLGAAERLREEIGSPLTADEREELEFTLSETRQAAGEVAFASAWAEGRQRTLEQVIETLL